MLTNEKIYFADTENYGRSLFAKETILRGEVVYIVTGPITIHPTIFTIPIDYNLFIDDQGLGKYLCHSCAPNCGINNRTQIVAMRDINKDEEINLDYAFFVYDYQDEMTEENRICKCGASSCRGKLGSYKELSQSLRDIYKGYISDFLLRPNI